MCIIFARKWANILSSTGIINGLNRIDSLYCKQCGSRECLFDVNYDWKFILETYSINNNPFIIQWSVKGNETSSKIWGYLSITSTLHNYSSLLFTVVETGGEINHNFKETVPYCMPIFADQICRIVCATPLFFFFHFY